MPGRHRRHRRALTCLTVPMALGLGLSACGGGTSPGSATSDGAAGGDQADTIAVTLITKDNINPFFVTMQDGAKEAGAKNGVDITLAAGAKDGDEDGQVKAIEAAVARGDQGILITPSGPGVNAAINQARKSGLYVIALDTPPNPADTVDITFATDNFKAGQLIGAWAAKQFDGKEAKIALLDQFNDKVVSVDVARDQGFLDGMGIDTKDATRNGDEDKTGSFSSPSGKGTYSIACQEPTGGAQDEGKTAMENCLAQTRDINLVYTINEPAAGGASQALDQAGVKDATIVSVDGACNPGLLLVKDGVIGATSQQYPLKMAQLGVEAIASIARGGEKPAVTPGLDFYDTGVALVTDTEVDGLDSISVDEGDQLCWGSA